VTRCFPLGGNGAATTSVAAGITDYPNLPEAAALLDAPHARNEREMHEQGHGAGMRSGIIKAGIWIMMKARTGCLPVMALSVSPPRIKTKNTHGTGCTLSAALAALRPRHADWASTVNEAKRWLSALAQADTLEVGHGIGPVHHFHQWW
jgi:hydroxymethylpyrimidine/phosphomethylpyrimidine kinase